MMTVIWWKQSFVLKPYCSLFFRFFQLLLWNNDWHIDGLLCWFYSKLILFLSFFFGFPTRKMHEKQQNRKVFSKFCNLNASNYKWISSVQLNTYIGQIKSAWIQCTVFGIRSWLKLKWKFHFEICPCSYLWFCVRCVSECLRTFQRSAKKKSKLHNQAQLLNVFT